MGSRTSQSWQRAAAFVAVGALLSSLPACGNRLAKEQLLADNAGGTAFTQTGQSDALGAGAVSNPGAVDTGSTTATVPVATGAARPVASGTGTATGTATGTNTKATPGKSDPGKTESSAGPPSGQATCTGVKSEVAIGTVGGQSGFIGAVVRSGVDAIKAWVADINAKGGLNCHPIRYYVADDGGDPSKNAALTQQMIEDRKVIAMLFSNNPLSAQGGKPILEKAHVPTIGSEGADEYFNTSPDFFPLAATGDKLIEAEYANLKEELTPEQAQHVGVLSCLEAPVCSTFGGAHGTRIGEKVGLKIVYSSQSTMVQPDYTSNCQSAKDAGVQAFFTAADVGLTSRLIRSCAKIGFKPQFATGPVGLASTAPDLPELEGMLLGSTAMPWVSDHPLTKRYVSTLAKYLPGALPGGSGAIGWAAAMVFEKIGAGFPDNSTAQDVYNGLYKLKKFDFDGYMTPVTFAKDKPASTPVCWWSMAIRNKQWVSTDGNKRACRT